MDHELKLSPREQLVYQRPNLDADADTVDPDNDCGDFLVCPACCCLLPWEDEPGQRCTCDVEPIHFWAERNMSAILAWLGSLERPLGRQIVAELHRHRATYCDIHKAALYAAKVFYGPKLEASLQSWSIASSEVGQKTDPAKSTLAIPGWLDAPIAVDIIDELAHVVVYLETGRSADYRDRDPAWLSAFLRAADRAREIGDEELAASIKMYGALYQADWLKEHPDSA